MHVHLSLKLDASTLILVYEPSEVEVSRHFEQLLKDLPGTVSVVDRLLTHQELQVLV